MIYKLTQTWHHPSISPFPIHGQLPPPPPQTTWIIFGTWTSKLSIHNKIHKYCIQSSYLPNMIFFLFIWRRRRNFQCPAAACTSKKNQRKRTKANLFSLESLAKLNRAKSVMTTFPFSMKMFLDLRSLWTIPLACKYPIPCESQRKKKI